MSPNAHRPEPGALPAPEPNDGSRSGLCGRRGSVFWLCRVHPRTRSPLLRRLRLCHRLISAIRCQGFRGWTGSPSLCGRRLCDRFTREISRLRCSTRSPPCGLRLGTQIDIYRRRCCWRRHLRCCLCLGLPTEPERLSHRRAALRVNRGGERVIAPQSPLAQIFVPIESVLGADVPSERLGPIATIEAHHVILMNGSPHRHGGNQNFLYLNGLSELTQRVMNCGDQVRKLLWSHRVVSNVAADDHNRGMWVSVFGIHDHPFALSWLTIM